MDKNNLLSEEIVNDVLNECINNYTNDKNKEEIDIINDRENEMNEEFAPEVYSYYEKEDENKTLEKKKKSSSVKFIPKRKPMSHEIGWEEEYDENLTPKQRAERANTYSINDLNNYDVVINENEAGYRNNGVFIYKDNELHPLSGYPDDYGSLPEWVEIRKEDCGHSYFSDYLIDHNSYVPFHTNDWEIGESYVDEEIKPFKFAYSYINVKTDLYRTLDGAKATTNYSVMISAPWLGGPTEDCEENGGGSDGTNSHRNYRYEDGKSIRIDYTYNKDHSKKYLLEPLNSQSKEVNIPKNIIEKATRIVNEKIKSYLKREQTVYLESISPCDLDIQLPRKWKGREYYNISTVIPLEQILDKEQSSSSKEGKEYKGLCEKNIERNVLNKLDRGELYIKKHKITDVNEAQTMIDSMVDKYCKSTKDSQEKIQLKKSSSSKKTQKSNCTKRNPDPPCNEGYEEKLTKKGDNCCYKSSKKTGVYF